MTHPPSGPQNPTPPSGPSRDEVDQPQPKVWQYVICAELAAMTVLSAATCVKVAQLIGPVSVPLFGLFLMFAGQVVTPYRRRTA